MKFYFFPIAPSINIFKSVTFLWVISLTIAGCSPSVTPEAPKPIVASAQPSPESTPTPEIKSDSKPEPVPARSLTTPTNALKENPLKEKKLDENKNDSSDSKQKPIANRALLFSCLTDNGKEILLYQTDDTIDYSFGDPGSKPELDIQVPRNQASTWQWKGVGRAMTYAVDVPNGDTSYSVFWSVDRLSPTKEIEAGVRVHRDRKTLATVYCTDKIVSNLQGVQLKPTEY
jgi:hypothetical protein